MAMKDLKRGDVNYFAQAFAKAQIDEDNGILRDVVLVQEGEAKGHDVRLDGKFVKKITKLGKAQGDSGVKSRFGHPAMSEDANGTQLGRFKNFRNRRMADGIGVESIADLHLFSEEILGASNKVPNIEWFIGMAKDNADAFGNSIVFHSAGTEEREFELENGEIEMRDFELPPLSLPWSDLVNEGAATESLFSSEMMIDKAVRFLDSNKDIYEMLCAHPDAVSKVETVLNRVKAHKDYKSNKSKSMSETTEQVEGEVVELSNVEKETASFFGKLEERFDKFFSKKEEVIEEPKTELEILTEQYSTKFDELEERFSTLSEITAAKDAVIEQLTADNDKLKEDYGQLARKEAGPVELKTSNPEVNAGDVKTELSKGERDGELLKQAFNIKE